MKNKYIYLLALVIVIALIIVISFSIKSGSLFGSAPQFLDQKSMPADTPGLRLMVTNVFAGRAIKELGNSVSGNTSVTQYQVETGNALKGQAPKTVTVANPYGNLTLKINEPYTFFVNYDSSHDWYVIVGVYPWHKPAIDY